MLLQFLCLVIPQGTSIYSLHFDIMENNVTLQSFKCRVSSCWHVNIGMVLYRRTLEQTKTLFIVIPCYHYISTETSTSQEILLFRQTVAEEFPAQGQDTYLNTKITNWATSNVPIKGLIAGFIFHILPEKSQWRKSISKAKPWR